MSFKPVNLTLWSNFQSPNTPVNLPQWWGYLTVGDNIAAVSTAGYFNNDPGALLQNTSFRINDLLYCACTDGIVELEITALTPNITTVAFAVPAGSVTNASVAANAAIAFSKLAALPSTDILVGSAGNVATAVALSGDATLSNTGALTIANNAVNTAKLDPTTIQYIKVPMTAAQFNGMYGAPFQIIPAPAAGKQIIVRGAVLAMTFVAAQYAAGGAVALQYDSTVHGAGPLASSTLAAATVNAYAASSDVGLTGADTSGASSAKTAKGIYLSNDTAAFTTGDGTWNIHVWYEVVTL